MGRTPRSGGTPATTRTLDRGLRLLEILADGGEMTLAELSAASGLAPATALRLLDTLRARDFVAADEGKYRVGLKTFEVGSAFLSHTRLLEVCHPILMRLAEETGLGASLAIQEGRDAIVVDTADGARSRRTAARIGMRAPLHACAAGKVLLAWLWEGRVLEILGPEPFEAVTPDTIRSAAPLLDALGEVRASGTAREDEELEPGLGALAAPVRDRKGHVAAALAVASPATRMRPPDAGLVARLAEAAGDASLRLGWRDARAADLGDTLTD